MHTNVQNQKYKETDSINTILPASYMYTNVQNYKYKETDSINFVQS